MILVGLFLYAPIIILIVFFLQRRQQLQRVEGLFPPLVRRAAERPAHYAQRAHYAAGGPLLATVIATVAGTFAAIGFTVCDAGRAPG